jgi:hypothetical protein
VCIEVVEEAVCIEVVEEEEAILPEQLERESRICCRKLRKPGCRNFDRTF